MKTDSLFVVTALAIAAGLVFMPRRAAPVASSRGVLQPGVTRTDAASVWTDQATAQYREQLARETGSFDWYGP